MTFTHIVLLVLAILISAGLAFYQYLYKVGKREKISFFLAFLRFVTIFSILLLLINPRILRSWYEPVKTPLAVVGDNSSSILDLKADKTATDVWEKILSDNRLKEKFDVVSYHFSDEPDAAKTLDFKGKQTNIDAVAKDLQSIYRNQKFPTILITDGNATRGGDFVHRFKTENPVFPIVLGDTVQQPDLRITQLNANKYAFLKNKFPVEVFLQYSGKKSISAKFEIKQGNQIVAAQTVQFSPSKRSEVLNLLLPAEKTGLQIYKASVTSAEKEKNTYNNVKNFAVEILNQRTEIGIVSAINHPDIGALKRAIEINAQRKVSVLGTASGQDLSKYNLLIFYQPNASVTSIWESAEKRNSNILVITGMQTDYAFLNSRQKTVEFRMSSQPEQYLPQPNSGFSLFAPEELPVGELPPLENAFGTIKASGNFNTLFDATVRNVATGSPLMGFAEEKGRRSGFIFGEGIWKWRMQTYVTNRNFEAFDRFIDKAVQYLSSDNSKKSLAVSHESFFNSGETVEISAQYFDKNYEFDPNARLNVTLTHRTTKKTRSFDMLRSSGNYKLSLDGLEAGAYDFRVRELRSNATYSGYFELLDFDIEKQFVNPDVERLDQLASLTSGKLFLPDQTDALIEKLLKDESYKIVEKKISKRLPLIDSIWLLCLIAVSLATEWFIRKYNGML